MKIKNERNGTYDDFLNAILTFESTIDPQKAQYYAENYDNPTATLSGCGVSRPGYSGPGWNDNQKQCLDKRVFRAFGHW